MNDSTPHPLLAQAAAVPARDPDPQETSEWREAFEALAMVVRANQAESGGSSELGGHIASYASAADLFETGFNHFFHAREGMDEGQHCGDLVWGTR
jgi:pyruvate dehydrogenase complex dehydrogenase (E1) component